MTHEIRWLKPNRVLYVSYQEYQTPDTLLACLDDIVVELDAATQPVAVLINWLEVTGQDPKTLMSHRGHRAYSHPNSARAVLVGFDQLEAFQNEITAVNTRGNKHTIYFKTVDEALEHLKEMLEA